jgi:hypothetical protein
MRRRAMVALSVLVLVCAGCLVEETTHTLYLEADGSVVWSVSQALVRSSSERRAEREEEETKYLAEAYASQLGVAAGLRELGATGVTTQVTRTRRPFSATTEGRFASLEGLLRSLTARLDVESRLDFATEGAVTRLRLEVQPTPEDEREAKGEKDGDHPSDALFTGGRCRLVLARGRFLESHGFELSGDGTVATPVDLRPEAGRPVVYELAWTTAEP